MTQPMARQAVAHEMSLGRWWSDGNLVFRILGRRQIVFAFEREIRETSGLRLSRTTEHHIGHSESCQTRSKDHD